MHKNRRPSPGWAIAVGARSVKGLSYQGAPGEIRRRRTYERLLRKVQDYPNRPAVVLQQSFAYRMNKGRYWHTRRGRHGCVPHISAICPPLLCLAVSVAQMQCRCDSSICLVLPFVC